MCWCGNSTVQTIQEVRREMHAEKKTWKLSALQSTVQSPILLVLLRRHTNLCCFIFCHPQCFPRPDIESISTDEITIIYLYMCAGVVLEWVDGGGPQPCWNKLPGLMLSSPPFFQMFTNSDEAVINKKLPKELLLRWVTFWNTSIRVSAEFLQVEMACCIPNTHLLAFLLSSYTKAQLASHHPPPSPNTRTHCASHNHILYAHLPFSKYFN